MALGHAGILKEMEHGHIVIEPFDERQLGSNSYDCRLGEWYFEPQPTDEVVDFTREEDVRRFWGEPRHASDGLVILKPQTTILGHTIERIGGREHVTTMMRARSSMSRCCLSVCKSAGLGDVGYVSRWTMELTNHSGTPIALHVGMRVCQILFYDVGDTIDYQGKYGHGEWSPSDMLPKLYRDWDLDLVRDGSRPDAPQDRVVRR